MTKPVAIRTYKRLTAAEGYLELELPDLALEELAGIEMEDPYSAVVDWLTGEALKDKEQYDEAIVVLSRAVRWIPAPHNRRAVQSLAECFRRQGRDDLAEVAEMFAHSESLLKDLSANEMPFFDPQRECSRRSA